MTGTCYSLAVHLKGVEALAGGNLMDETNVLGRDTPVVDVVICTHNRPELLRRALDSALGQDYPGMIVVTIVFDRTEPDLSLQRREERRVVQVVRNERTPGLAGARNTGIEAGHAPLVAFCDDDDTWQPGKLSAQVERLQITGARTCVTGVEIVFAEQSTVRLARDDEMTLQNLIRNRVMPAHPSSVLVWRDSLESTIGLVDEHIPGSYGEDYDWILRAAQAGAICTVPLPMVRVLWGQSLFSGRWATIIEALDYLVMKFPQFRDDRRALARIRGQQAFGLAALGRRRAAFRVIGQTMRLSVREKRAYVALSVACGLAKPETIMALLHRQGRGI